LSPGESKIKNRKSKMNEAQFKARTKALALRVIRLVEALPKSRTADVIGKQLLRSGTSVGANYRAACRARSTADMLSKLGIVEEEADESVYWMELLIEAGIVPEARLAPLMSEMNEILAMIVASRKTLNQRKKRGG
jgi:four helix bundle protein